jgi:hypothetical protein
MLYSYRSQTPGSLPFRIRLSNGQTRTEPATFTAEEIADAGYTPVRDMPVITENQRVSWSSELIDWVVTDKTPEEIEQERQDAIARQWNAVRKQRDQLMKDFEWRYTRHAREVRLALTPTDSILLMDTYMQTLADITEQSDPFNIIWPTY